MPDNKNNSGDDFDLNDSPFDDGEEVNLDDFPGPDGEFDDDDFPNPLGEENEGDNEDFADLDGPGETDDFVPEGQEVSDDFDNDFDDKEDTIDVSDGDIGDYYDEDVTMESNQSEGFVDKIRRQAIPLGAGVLVIGFVGYTALSTFGPLIFGPSAPPQAQFTAAPQSPDSNSATAPDPTGGSSQSSQQQSVANNSGGEPVPPSGLPTGPATDPTTSSPSASSDAQNNQVGQPLDMDDTGSTDMADLEFDDPGATPSPQLAPPVEVGGSVVLEEDLSQFVSKNDLSDILSETIEDSLGNRLNQVLDAVDIVSLDVSNLMNTMGEVEGRVDGISVDVDNVRSDMASMENKVENYVDRVDELEFKLDNMSTNSSVRETEDSDDIEVSEADEEPEISLPSSEETDHASAEDQKEEISKDDNDTASSEAQVATPKPKPTPSPQRTAAPQKPSRPASGNDLSPPSKPMVVNGYTLKGVSRGIAWIETGNGVLRVEPGQSIEGLGRVHRISRGQGDWMVTTDAGLIIP